ncbi:response regulator [Nonomuraea soli]|uniref:DNA-binding NarL/FixJ family response regulator n=1 Tax=Nonomuraea soli TaxID=1032476 RepID=A0A7W0CT29_9ACTN|nr:response regulator transcription factor [Nonomuraea soli]MBA2896712.1 DNA-binding NarL/FixJ family response regulator [Nonomuraea soli]
MIRLLLVDDEALVRHGLRTILESDPDIVVVDEATDGVEAVELAYRHRPDIVLTDIRMPRADGLATTRELTRLPNPPKVIVLTTFGLDEYIYGALKAGAVGFLLKDTPPADLIQGVKTVAEGNAMLSPCVTMRVINEFADQPATEVPEDILRRFDTLTEREREVLRLVTRGLANSDIAQELFMSEATVKTHVSHVLNKLGVGNRVQAAIWSYRLGV